MNIPICSVCGGKHCAEETARLLRERDAMENTADDRWRMLTELRAHTAALWAALERIAEGELQAGPLHAEGCSFDEDADDSEVNVCTCDGRHLAASLERRVDTVEGYRPRRPLPHPRRGAGGGTRGTAGIWRDCDCDARLFVIRGTTEKG